MAPVTLPDGQTKGSGDSAGAFFPELEAALYLVHLARDVAERIGQLRAKAVDDRDDRDRDACSDQAVLDRGRAGLVTKEGFEQAHLLSPDLKLCVQCCPGGSYFYL